MIAVTLIVLILFFWTQINSRIEPPSPDSGANFAITLTMVVVIFILSSFSSLTIVIDKNYLKIKFGYGIFRKQFFLDQIVSARAVKNHWIHGWGIRLGLHPYMWIYNVSGFDAVEIVLKNGKIYRLGTNAPKELEAAINKIIKIPG